MSASLRIVPADENDVPTILHFIRKLAEYEKLSEECIATEDLIREALFGARPVAEVLLAYWADEPAGFALYLRNFSTFLGQTGIYLEDLFVEPAFRGRGIGKALMVYLARITRERNYGRLEWAVLDWNRPAIEFYHKLGAAAMHDWTIFRLTGEALRSLAAASSAEQT